ncbi:MAG: hypothetical protein PW792_17195 [Acidobacteriaceae bacterium]|nr:hypothetical protein [Acidobacteriaceae bacterium]
MKKAMVAAAMLVGAGAMFAQSTATIRAVNHGTESRTFTLTSSGEGMMRVSAQGAGEEPQGKDELFAGTEVFEKNATEVTDISMDPSTLSMVGGKNASSARRMVLNTVRTYEYDQPGMYNMAEVDKIRQRLNTGDWHCSVHTRNLKTGESTDVCSKTRTDGYSEQAIISVEKKELTFIHRVSRVGAGGGGESSLLGGTDGVFYGSPSFLLLNTLPGEMAALRAEIQATVAGANVAQLRGLGDLNRDVLRMRMNEIHPMPQKQFEKLRIFIKPAPAAAPAPAPQVVPDPVAPPAPAKPLE